MPRPRAIAAAVIILLAYVIILAWAGMAMAADCTPLSEIRVKAASHNARVALVDDTRATQALNAFYNAQPPESTDSFSAVYVITFPGGQSSIMFGNGDMLCAEMRMPTEVVTELLRRMMGVSL